MLTNLFVKIVEALKNRLFQIICMFECHDVHVEAICSDLGPVNKALLNLLGVYARFKKGSTNLLEIPNYKICNTFSNLFRDNATIKVFLDFTHIFKRLKGQLERTDFIFHESTRAYLMKEYNLSLAEYVCSFHWIRLLHHREEETRLYNGAIMTLTNLSTADIWPSGFQRMRVKHTSKVFSPTVESALIAYKIKYIEFSKCHPTAILLMEASRWFKIVNNYHSDLALSASNKQSFKTMKQIIKTFAQMIVVGKFVKTNFPEDFPEGYHLPKSAIKLIQSSIAISSQSLDMIATDVIQLLKAPQLFSANTTQDQTESLFSSLRSEGFGNPTPLRVLEMLKNIILTFRNLTNKNFEFFKLTDSHTLLEHENIPDEQLWYNYFRNNL